MGSGFPPLSFSSQFDHLHSLHISSHGRAILTVFRKSTAGAGFAQRNWVGSRRDHFLDTQVLLKMSAKAKSQGSWGWIIHSLSPAGAPLPHRAPFDAAAPPQQLNEAVQLHRWATWLSCRQQRLFCRSHRFHPLLYFKATLLLDEAHELAVKSRWMSTYEALPWLEHQAHLEIIWLQWAELSRIRKTSAPFSRLVWKMDFLFKIGDKSKFIRNLVKIKQSIWEEKLHWVDWFKNTKLLPTK